MSRIPTPSTDTHTSPGVASMLARRTFLARSGWGLGGVAASTLLAGATSGNAAPTGAVGGPHVLPRARRVISLFMHGGPSQLDLFDHKPELARRHGEELPPSVRGTQRLTGMTSGQKSFPVTSSLFQFAQHGESGAWVSELLPHMAGIVDRMTVVRSLHTEAINHDPAVTLLQTGHQQPGRPSFGAWAGYGLGAETDNLPAFVVMISKGSAARPADPLYARLWGSGFLPSNHQGVALRSAGDPVLYLSNPDGLDARTRRDQLDLLAELNRGEFEREGDPEIATRMSQYEMAFRMQASVPELTDLASESRETFDLYGPESRRPGTFAANCFLARRMVERGVRFVQLYHRGWDQHYNLPATCGCNAAMSTSRRRRWCGLGATGIARRHARGVGGRVWSDGVQPGDARADQLWSRPPRGLLFDVDGRWRDQTGSSVRVDRRVLVQRRRQAGPRPRLERDAAASVGDRPYAAGVSASGSGLPPDRRAWDGGAWPAGVRGSPTGAEPRLACAHTARNGGNLTISAASGGGWGGCVGPRFIPRGGWGISRGAGFRPAGVECPFAVASGLARAATGMESHALARSRRCFPRKPPPRRNRLR